jgi:NADPH-dependent curcumin reductase CurA
MSNIQVRLKSRPDENPSIDNFEIISNEMPSANEGEVLCKTLYLSLDPYMRGQISGRHISGTINPGELMRGECVGEVIDANGTNLDVGDKVAFHGGWQTYFTAPVSDVKIIDKRLNPASLALGIMGMPGLTAYAGLFHLAEIKTDDVVLVSAASGAVGSMVGQIAKIQGCRVIGIAGSLEKCAWLMDVARFDGCINYKSENLVEAIKRECPDGIDIYFDNVGGDILDAAMWQLAIGARVVLCGLMAQYNCDTIPPGPNPATIIKARATVRGMVVYDHFHRTQAFHDRTIPWLQANKIKFREDISEGLDAAPAAFERLMNGKNFGKTIIKVT